MMENLDICVTEENRLANGILAKARKHERRGQKSPNRLDAMVWALTSLMRQRQTISMALIE